MSDEPTPQPEPQPAPQQSAPPPSASIAAALAHYLTEHVHREHQQALQALLAAFGAACRHEGYRAGREER